MVNDDLMFKINSLMQGLQLVFIRGQLRNIVRATNEHNLPYYLADLKVPRSLDSNDVYGVSFDLIHVCFSSDFVSHYKLNDDSIKVFKDNEVLVNLNINCTIKQYKSGTNDVFKSNVVRFYVEDIVLLNSISKPNFINKKVVSL